MNVLSQAALQRCGAMVVIAAMVTSGLDGGAAEFPEGVFFGTHQADWSISFGGDGTFSVSSSGKTLVKGVYDATETEITFTDQSGPLANTGNAATGTYAWQHDWGTLVFTEISDESEGRELLLTGNEWVDIRLQRLGGWIKDYYKNPTPDALVEMVNEMSEIGVFVRTGRRGRPDANVMFIGQVMKANPSRIGEWMAALSMLPASEQEVLKRAVWYSGTDEGRNWLVDHGDTEMADGPRPIVFADQVGFMLTDGDEAVQLQPYHLDQYWEWFFATGEGEPVLRVTKVFGLAHDTPTSGTLDLLPPPEETPDDVSSSLMASNYRLVSVALWSATALACEHDRVLSILLEQRQQTDDARVRPWIERVIAIAEARRRERDSSPAE